MWTTAFALTLLFFAIQLGTGFSILAIAPTKLIDVCRFTKVQFIILGGTVGGSATGILLGLLSLLIGSLWLQFAIVIAVSCFGLVWTWSIWRPRTGELRTATTWCILSLPMAFAIWWWSFGAFSNFPYADMGADVHWMKTAQEYADSGVINPFAGQSYVDLRSAPAGVLSGTLGLDLLQFSWTYRYFSILFFLLASYGFAQGVFADPVRKWITFFFAAPGTVALMTNGSLAVASSVVFLGVLMRNTGGDAKDLRTGSAVPLISAVGTLLLAFTLNNNTLVLALLIVGLLLLRVLNKLGNLTGALFLGCAWPATLLLAHRGSYLFVPAVITSWLLYLIIVRALSAWPSRSISILRLVSFVLPLAVAGIVAGVAGMRLGYIPSTNANETFSFITGLILNRRIQSGDELFLGAGPQIAAIELGRAIGPVFAICVTLGVAWWWMTIPVPRDRPREVAPRADGFVKLVWSWISGCGLSLVVLSGFPFLYRSTAIVLALFTITAAELFCQLLIDAAPSSRYRRALVAATVVLLVTILVIAVYAVAWPFNLRFADYQAFLRPSELAGIVLLMALSPLTLARSRPIYTWSLVGVVALAFAIDRAGLSGMTKTYSYGPLPDKTAVVSHYNASDLAAARWLHEHLKKSIVLSDPYTQGLVQALTGAPALYLFSNLDTVNEAVARQAKASLAAILERDNGGRRLARVCSLIAPFLRNINSESLFQIRRSHALTGVLKPVREAKAPELTPGIIVEFEEEQRSNFKDLLESGGDSWGLVALINPRTIEWTQLAPGQRLGYFPPMGRIDPGLAKMLDADSLPVLYANEQSMVVRIPCSD